MIPYDELVTALTNWRAKQGLPLAGPAASPITTPAPASGPTGKPGSGPTRGAPPMAPPKPQAHGMYQPPPLAPSEAVDEAMDVDDAALLEEAHYDNEGDDFAMNFSQVERNDDESTTLGHAPTAGQGEQRDSFGGETLLDPHSAPKSTKKPW